LGEHFELTAVKAAGVSLTRTIQPIFFFVVILTVLAFYANNYLVPKAALEAYSLLWDIKQKKPALDLREGTFYYGIPDISIKVDKKFEDGETIKDIIIYDHRDNEGNKNVYVADSGRMYTILNERYLKLELFDGYNYTEGIGSESDLIGQKQNPRTATLSRNKFDKTYVVFELSSFNLERTDKKWFQSNRIMGNMNELELDLDSINREIMKQRLAYYQNQLSYFLYFNKNDTVVYPDELYMSKLWYDSTFQARFRSNNTLTQGKPDSLKPPVAQTADTIVEEKKPATTLAQKNSAMVEKLKATTSRSTKAATANLPSTDTLTWQEKGRLIDESIDSIFNLEPDRHTLQGATNMARQVKNLVSTNNAEVTRYHADLLIFRIQWHKIIASSFACI